MSACIYHGGGPASWDSSPKDFSSEKPEKRASNPARQPRNSAKKGKVLKPPKGSGWDLKPRMNHKRLCELFDALPQEQQQQLETLLESPPQERARMLNTLSAHFAKKAQATPFETIAANYKPYQGRKLDSEAILKHLKDQLGEHLEYFDAPANAIYLDQLRKIEPQTDRMDGRLNYERRRGDNVPRLSEIVPKKTIRMSQEVKIYPDTAEREFRRIATLKHTRRKKTTQLPTAEVG